MRQINGDRAFLITNIENTTYQENMLGILLNANNSIIQQKLRFLNQHLEQMDREK